MFELIAVTNRKLCREDFLTRIEWLAQTEISAILLREKDLSPDEYESLARQVLAICDRAGKRCILHHFAEAAARLGQDEIQLSLPDLERFPQASRRFQRVGVSVHSLEDAMKAASYGAFCLTAGHVFATDCKKGLPPRGIPFLEGICKSVSLPVYAIGGINEENIVQIRESGAAGACIMSALMQAEQPEKLVQKLRG